MFVTVFATSSNRVVGAFRFHSNALVKTVVTGLQTIRAQRIVSGSTRTAMFIDDDLTVFVRFAPFRVQVSCEAFSGPLFRSSNFKRQVQRGGKIRLTVNAKDLMQFETYRKPNPKPENEGRQ